MSQRLEFFVAGVPETEGSVRALLPRNRRRPVVVHANKKGLRSWRHLIVSGAMEARNRAGFPEVLFDGPVALELRFYLLRPAAAKSLHTPKQQWLWMHPWRRPDVDKLARACLDALTGVLFADDGQVVRLVAEKSYGMPGVRIIATLLVDRPVLA